MAVQSVVLTTRQPCRFEGLLLGVEHRDPRDLSVDHRVEGGKGAIYRNSTAFAAPRLPQTSQYRPGAEVGKSLALPPIVLERPCKAAKELRDGLMAIERRVNPAGAGYIQDDVGIQKRKSARGILRAPCLDMRAARVPRSPQTSPTPRARRLREPARWRKYSIWGIFPSRIVQTAKKWMTIGTPLSLPRPLWRMRPRTRPPGASTSSSGSPTMSTHPSRYCSVNSRNSATPRRCCGVSGYVCWSRQWSSNCGSKGSAMASPDSSPRMNALNSLKVLRTISTFSCDIAYAVSRRGCCFPCKAAVLLFVQSGYSGSPRPSNSDFRFHASLLHKPKVER